MQGFINAESVPRGMYRDRRTIPSLCSIYFAAAMRNPTADRVSRQGRDVSRQRGTPSTFNILSTRSNFVWSYISPNYPAEQPILKHGGITFPAERGCYCTIFDLEQGAKNKDF